MRIVVVIAILLCMSNAQADAKCARVFVNVKGSVAASQADDLTVRLAIDPEPNEKASSTSVKDHQFEVQATFDPTSGTKRGRDRCSRSPVTVTVLLLRGDEIIERKTLHVSTDFEKDGDGDYFARALVAFEGRHPKVQVK